LLQVTPLSCAGAVLDDKYRVEGVIGRGGMAVVVAATHRTVGHRVAIKLLQPDRTIGPSDSARMLLEARAATALKSEHVTRVLDVGELDSGHPYLVLELLEGIDFGRLLEQQGPLSVRDAAEYLVQACEAIAEAHARGIVHRDLKPSNLFLARRADGAPLVKLMDFGVSKILDGRPDEALTATRDGLGTPHYMSPEQLVCARDVDARTDVWALGVLLYRLLTGTHPFDGPSAAAVHVAIATLPAPMLRDARPDAPVLVEELVDRCLVKDRAVRLKTAAEFAAALLPLTTEETQRRYRYLCEVAATARGQDTANARDGFMSIVRGVDGRTGRRGRVARVARRVGVGAVLAVAVLGIAWLPIGSAVRKPPRDVAARASPGAAAASSALASREDGVADSFPSASEGPEAPRIAASAPAPDSETARTSPKPASSSIRARAPASKVRDPYEDRR
jgi:serine/threonine-protein kinase